MRLFSYLFVVICLLIVVLPAARAAEDVDTILEKIYTSDLEAKGEIDMFIEELTTLFKDNIRSPVAPVIYNRILDLLPLATDPSLLDPFFSELAQFGKSRGFPNGFLATDAMGMQYNCLLRQGLFEEAEALDAFSPFAKNMLAIGPLGFSTGSLHDIEFAPEKSLDSLESVEGLDGVVDWKLIRRESNKAGFNLHKHFYPQTGCFYALYPFQLSRDRGILLAFAGPGSVKIWFNGEQLADHDHRKAFLSNRIKIPLSASEGWNHVLIKLSSGDPNFSLMITDRTGYALTDLTEIKERALEPCTSTASGKAIEIDMGSVDMLAFLATHTNLHPENAYAAAAYADVLAKKGLITKAVAEAKRSVALLPEDPHLLFLLGTTYENARYLPRNFRTNKAKELYDRAVESDAEFLPAQVALGMLDHQNDRSEEAIGRLQDVVEKSPRYYDAWLTLASIFDKLGWSNELHQTMMEAKKLAPRDVKPYVLLAQFNQDLQRYDLAFEQYRKALDLDASLVAVIEQVAAYLWDRGETAEAFGLYERVLSLRDNDFNKERMAGLHRALGDPVKAKEIFEELTERHPRQARFYALLGDLALELDSFDEAVTWYRKALEVSPQEHNLREILQDWKKIDDPLFAEFLAEEGEYITNLPDKDQYPKASAICSLDHMITKVYDDGSSKSEIYQVYKIMDKDAVEEFGRMSVPGRLIDLKILQPDGKVLEPIDAEGRGTFNLPGLDVGSIIVLRHALYQQASPGTPLDVGGFFFQDTDGTTPFLFSRYIVSLPKGLEITKTSKIPSAFQEERLVREDAIVYVFSARQMPVEEKEILMPPDKEAFPNVDLHQSLTWTQASQIMANNHYGHIRLTEELKAKAGEVTDGLESYMDKAAAIYAFVNDHVREDRGSADATHTLIEKQGRRINLFMALMNASGLEYDYLRCGYRDGYLAVPPDWSDVSGGLLPNELIRLQPDEGGPMLLSFDSRLQPFGEIPHYLYGAPAMKVTGRPDRIETLPGGDSMSWLEEEIVLDISVNFLDATIKGKLSLPGNARIRFRESMQRMDANNRRNLFEYNIIRGIYPGAQVKELEILGIDDEDTVPTFAFELEAKDFIFPVGERDGCRLLPVPMNMTGRFIRQMERKFPMINRGYSSYRFVMNIDLNNEYKVVNLPESLVERRFFINYSLICSKTDTGIRIERLADFSPADVEPHQYPKLIDMLKAIDEREVEPVVLLRTGKPAGEAEGTEAGEAEGAEASEEKEPAPDEGESAAGKIEEKKKPGESKQNAEKP